MKNLYLQRGKYLVSQSGDSAGRRVVTASGRVFSGTGNPRWGMRSSPELLDVMRDMALRERNELCREVSRGDVELEVTFHITADSEELTFRVGREQKYIVKNVKEFVQNIRSQNYVQYGKKLGFVHSQSAFSRESLPMLSFLLSADLSVPHSMYYRMDNHAYRAKCLSLDAGMLDEVMELFRGKTLLVSHPLASESIKAPVLCGDPLLPVRIRDLEEKRGARIDLPGIYLLEGSRRIYVWWENAIYICSDEFCARMRGLLGMMAVNAMRSERHSDWYHYGGMRSLKPFELSEPDYPAFVSTLLPILESCTDLSVSVDFSEYAAEEGEYELYLDLTEDEEVVCRARAIYGEREHDLSEEAKLSEVYRDVRAEFELLTLLTSYFPERTEDGKQFLLRNDDDRLAELVEYGLQQLEELADVYVSEALRSVRIARDVHVRAGMAIRSGLLEVSWDIEGMSEEELTEILHAYHRRRQYYRLRSGEILNLQASGFDVLAGIREDLALTEGQMRSGSATAPLYRALYLDERIRECGGRMQSVRDESFRQYLERADDVLHRKYEVPDAVRGELRGYQREGFSWACALAELGFGGILADDMGLGKTLQMIAFLCYYRESPSLVVCPASLVYNWEAELQKFAPSLRVGLLVGDFVHRSEVLRDCDSYDVLITSYDLLRRDLEEYEDRQFGCVVADEAQYIKNRNTQVWRSLVAIRGRVRFALTGTPIENRLSELWSIFQFVMPGYLFSYKQFHEMFEEDIYEGGKEETGQAFDRLQRMIAPFLLRRLKRDVLSELPEKTEEVVYTRFGAEQEALYRAAEKRLVQQIRGTSGQEVRENKIRILAEITKLRQICCDPSLLYEDYGAGSAKLEVCMEVIAEAVECGHRVLVFSQFTSMLDILERRLRREGYRYFVLTGRTGKRQRRDMVERFQAGAAELFLISLKAGGTGLNLTAADVVIHYDPWWNVAAQNQATDRVYRIGQDSEVTVYRLIAKDTIEERILKLQEAKQDLADRVVSAEGVSVAGLSKEELLRLFE